MDTWGTLGKEGWRGGVKILEMGAQHREFMFHLHKKVGWREIVKKIK